MEGRAYDPKMPEISVVFNPRGARRLVSSAGIVFPFMSTVSVRSNDEEEGKFTPDGASDGGSDRVTNLSRQEDRKSVV